MANRIPIPVGLVVKKGSNNPGMRLGSILLPEPRTGMRISPGSSLRAHRVTSRGPRLFRNRVECVRYQIQYDLGQTGLVTPHQGQESGRSIDHEIRFILASALTTR